MWMFGQTGGNSLYIYEELRDLAVLVASAAGDLLSRRLTGSPIAVRAKEYPGDLVSDIDVASEQLIVRMLAEYRPEDAVLGEEGTARPGTSGVRWVLDPLDGTGNYLHGNPAFAVSVAAEVGDVVVAGAVRDPSRRETFSATRDGGAFRDSLRLTISGHCELASALVATGFTADPAVRSAQAQVLAGLLGQVRDIRCGGSAALDLCWLAAGRVDAYYEGETRYWDRAAGALIAEEAGAWVGGLDGGPADDRMVIAGPPALAATLRKVLSGS
jgi:myo-inositol-1(or 4)-monophosphatase